MKILVYSEAVNETQGGGANSTRTTIKYLEKYGNQIELTSDLNDFEEKIKNKPDIVLHHNVLGLDRITSICKRNNVPIITTINIEIACLTSTHITNYGNDLYGTPCYKCGLFRALWCNLNDNKYPWRYKLRRALSVPYRYFFIYPKKLKALMEVDGVICIGKTGPALFEKYRIKRKMYVSPQPIDDDDFLISEKDMLATKKEKLLIIPKTLEINRPSAIIDAFLEINRNDFKLICCNIKTNYYWEEFAEKYKAHENIIFTGPFKFADMQELYLKSYLTIFSMIEFGTFGRSWAESICCGTPVLSFKGRGAADDYLTHKETGYFMNYDIESIKSALNELLTNPELYEKLRINGLKYARKNLVASIVVPNLINIYKEVITEHRLRNEQH